MGEVQNKIISDINQQKALLLIIFKISLLVLLFLGLL